MADICHDCENPAWTGETIEAPAMPSGGDGGTNNFNALENRPKYDGTRMTGNTNIPDWTDEIEALQGDVEDIQALIPETTSTENQLADKDFVNSSIATNTASFVGTYESLEELEAVEDPSNNDYGFVISTDEAGNTVYNRYKYVSSLESWEFEYALNNSSFTAAQWAAITSGVTSGDMTLLRSLVQIFSIGTGLNLDANGNLSQKLYTETGDNEDGSMTQKATTEAIEEVVGLARELTEDDYNWPTSNPTSIAMWLMSAGMYSNDNELTVLTTASVPVSSKGCWIVANSMADSKRIIIKIGNDNGGATQVFNKYVVNTSTGASTDYVLVSAPINNLTSTSTQEALSAYQGKVLKELIGTLSNLDTTDQSDIVSAINEVLGDIPSVVQTTGTSTTDVMSQVAVTGMVFADPGYRQQIRIGRTSNATGTRAVAIGGDSSTNGENAVAIGYNSTATYRGSVALGSGATPSTVGEVNIGSAVSTSYGYNSSNYRLLTGLYDPQSDHDAANKEYVDNVSSALSSRILQNAGAPTTATEGAVGQLLEDTTNGDVYICTDATNPYVWERLATASELSEAAFGTTETYTIADSDWRLLSSSSPYKYYTTVSATTTIGNDTIVELLNDQPILFAKYGFAIASAVGQVVTLYATALPTSSTTLNINYRG